MADQKQDTEEYNKKGYQNPNIVNNNNDPNFQFFSTCLRIKYPKKTISFLVDNFDMILLNETRNESSKMTTYSLISSKANTKYPETNSAEANKLLSAYTDGVLQFVYYDGDDKNEKLLINNGNTKPFRGFGHFAFNTNDVYAVCEELEKKGVKFQKKPNEGRMKGLAFALDPNGYWIEIVSRKEWKKDEKYNLSQTMLRVKDAKKSLAFYVDVLGMRLVKEMHFEKGKFSLYFLSSGVTNDVDLKNMDGDEKYAIVKKLWPPVLELTHNWGTEDGSNDEIYHDGRAECDLGVGFCNVSFLTRLPLDAPVEMCDPDGYRVVLQQKGKTPVVSFKSDEIVPDVVDADPLQLLKVKYGNVELNNMGQTLTPTQVQDAPNFVEFNGCDSNKMYTVILTDPDARNREKHEYREWVHLVRVNVNGSDLVKSGDAVIEYVGSAPPKGSGIHRYVWLVYEQNNGKIELDKCGQKKLTSGGGKGDGRGGWKARKFVSDNKLGPLVAGTYYYAEYDEFVPKIYDWLNGKGSYKSDAN